MRIAIVGVGEVGMAYAAAAAAAGHDLVLVTPRPRPAVEAFAIATGASIVTAPQRSDLVAVDRVWLCVSGNITQSVFTELLDLMPPGIVMVDLTTAAASDKRACHALALQRGVTYVDCVIIGAVAITGARTPLLAAGATADSAVREFRAFGARVTVLDGAEPGDAATIKLLRTILTKGLESLAVECFMAAEREGLRDRLYDSLGDVDDMGFAAFLNMLVRTHVQHAGRRRDEVERAQAQLTEMGSPSLVLLGSRARFEATVAALADTPPSPASARSVDAALEWLIRAADERLAARAG